MGFAGKRETAKAVQPQIARIGDWATETALSFPFLTRNDILGLAGMRAVLAVDTGSHSSTYITEGRHSAAQASAMSTHSLLRCTIVNSGTTALSCGALKPDCTFISDWRIQYKASEGKETVIEIPQFRTSDDRLRCGGLMVRLRDAVKESLSTGIQLHLGDGPPRTDDLLVNMTANAKGYSTNGQPAFGYDYLGGVSDLHKQPLTLPIAARDAILAALDASAFRSKPGSDAVLRVVSLAGPRQFDAGSVTLQNTAQGDQLAINIPVGLPPIERQRSYRAALRLLAHIARVLEKSEPAVSASISTHAERIDSDTQETWKAAASGPKIVSKEQARAQRENELFQQHWDKTHAAPMIPIAADRWYPVGVRVITTAEGINYVSRAMEAADWVTNFKRTWAPGIRQTTRDRKRSFSARRCGLLRNTKGSAIPFLRYVWQPDLRDRVTTMAEPSNAWFWEVNARGADGEPPAHNSGMLFVSGWSHADGVIGYGENLLFLLQAFAEAVSVFDDRARIQSLYLAT
jgi:hypothetical protein